MGHLERLPADHHRSDWSQDAQPIPGATGRTYTPTSADVAKALTCTVQAHYALPPVTVQVLSSPATVQPATVPPAAVPAASLSVKARKAGKVVPRTGKATLVKNVTVRPEQTARITVKAEPKKTKKKVKITKTATQVKVRTKNAPRGKITAKITSSGAGFTSSTWSRTWKIR